MINEQYKNMLGGKSVIREFSEFAAARGKEIGYENVFDYSLGNPSVPAPAEFKQALLDLIEKEYPMTLHGYSPTLGIPSVKTAIAESLNCRFDMNYGPEPDTISYLLKQGATIAEVQAKMDERIAGESYLNMTKSMMYMLRMLLSILFIQNFRKRREVKVS